MTPNWKPSAMFAALRGTLLRACHGARDAAPRDRKTPPALRAETLSALGAAAAKSDRRDLRQAARLAEALAATGHLCPKPTANSIDEEIARRLQEAADSGELASARGYGQPLPKDVGWDSTPAALRMPMKILKDAGVTPPEIEMFHERARLKQAIEVAPDNTERKRLQVRLAELEQSIALRLEALRISASL
jgi:hypothetical protein